MIQTTRRMTGTSLCEESFGLHETDRSLDAARIFEVLMGNLAAYRIRGFVPENACRRISKNFWSSSEKVARAGDGEEGVEGYFIGASHYGKSTREYVEAVRQCKGAVESLYDGTIDPGGEFRAALRSHAGELVELRAARSDGYVAGDMKAVHWTGSGKFLLEPHDDLAQLSSPEQSDFEIQRADRVMAVNIYVQVPENSGQVQLWNIAPDDETRADLGLTHVGFPYPAPLLSDIPSMVIPVEKGDLLVFNGNLVHGVLRGNSTSSNRRLVLTFFMALIREQTELIWWT